jgi:uncharacterized protein YbjT (DUF2867 family)
MKVVVIGGTGLIGSKLVRLLAGTGHEVVAASPATGVNAVTGEGLADALKGAAVVVDVANSPSFAPDEVLAFFTAAGRNLAAAEREAGVGHHVALSIVGVDRLTGSGYMRAKVAQEELVAGSGVPYTIVRATQFFEFLGAVAAGFTVGGMVQASPALIQPVAADEVAATLAGVVAAGPANGVVELAGPEAVPITEMLRRHLAATGDATEVVEDPSAAYFGAPLEHTSLVPVEGRERLGTLAYTEWVKSAA